MGLLIHHQGGPEGAPALLLIPGFGATPSVFDPWLPELQVHWNVYFLDFLALVVSAPTASLQELGQQALALAPTKAVWAGWSLGGLLALAAAQQQPARVQALLWLASTPCFVQRENWPSAMTGADFDYFFAIFERSPEAARSRFIVLQTQGSATARDERTVLRRFSLTNVKEIYAQKRMLNWLVTEDWREKFRAVSIPVQAWWGQHDVIVPAAVAEALQKDCPSMEGQVLADTAHQPFLSHGSMIAAKFYEFMKRQGCA